MKKLFIAPLLLGLTSLYSQSLIKIGVTYSIGKEQSYLGKKKDLSHETNVNSSFGAGLTLDLGYVYLNNNNFGAEASVSFFISKPKTIEHEVNNQFDKATVIKSRMLFFSPALFIMGNSNQKIAPYLSSGLLFNLWQNVTKTELITQNKSDKIEKTWKVNLNKGIGYKSKLGIVYSSNSDILLFTEIQYQMFAIGYKNEELQSYTINQMDSLTNLTPSEKQLNYKQELTNESNSLFSTNFNPLIPTETGLKYANYNHFGLSGGVFIQNK